jgi:hypothetical protein
MSKNRSQYQRGIICLCSLLAIMLLSAGCVSTDPEKFAGQVRDWVPVGTSEKAAQRIMTRKGFECYTFKKDSPFNPFGEDFLGCEREQFRMHDWSVKFLLKDEQVIGYGPVTVDEVTVELD